MMIVYTEEQYDSAFPDRVRRLKEIAAKNAEIQKRMAELFMSANIHQVSNEPFSHPDWYELSREERISRLMKFGRTERDPLIKYYRKRIAGWRPIKKAKKKINIRRLSSEQKASAIKRANRRSVMVRCGYL